MFGYHITLILRKKLQKLSKKDPVLTKIFKKKLMEIIKHNKKTIDTYKNLKKPSNKFKRIHLTDNYILIFKVFKKEKHIIFVDIAHRDNIYKKL